MKRRSQYFVRGAFRRFYVPALISNVWIALAGFADCFLVGNSVGKDGLAAVSLGMPVYLFYNILSYGMSIGGSIHYASILAEGRQEEGNRIFNSVLRFLLLVYIVTAALALIFLTPLMTLLGANPGDAVTRTYITTQLMFIPVMFCQGPMFFFVNADNAPGLASLSISLSSLVDIVLSYVFLIRMRIGVAGSVYSTVAGAVVMLGMTGWHVLRKQGTLRFQWVSMDWKSLLLSARTGFSTSIQYLWQFITMIFVNRILLSLSGEGGVAAFDIVYNISTLFAAITDSAAVATEPMLSSYHSERNIDNIRATLRLALLWTGVLTAPLAAGMFLGADVLSTGFGLSAMPEHGYTVRGITIFLLSVPFSMLNAVFSGFYQSVFQERFAYWITFLRGFAFYLLSLFVCRRGGMENFWYFFTLTEALTLLTWLLPLALRRNILQMKNLDLRNVITVFIDSSSANISAIVQDIQAFCEERGCSSRQTLYIGLTIEEICCAIMDHFRERMGKIYTQITVVVEQRPGGMADGASPGGEGAGHPQCALYIRDNAYAYNPLAEDTGQIDLNSGRSVKLLGIDIVKKKADEFYYRRYSGFNTLVLRL